ncbi:MAG: SEC-C metal-binding domain-containing protein [Vicinamibacterales bacterium]|nr:SEC-C metal-binding domain-containing protein [Vicinamibacterales bacterium]
MGKAGRNDLCACGSGKKFKRCCATRTEQSTSGKLMLIAVVGAMLGALILGFTSMTDDSAPAGPGRVWSPEHGHYH